MKKIIVSLIIVLAVSSAAYAEKYRIIRTNYIKKNMVQYTICKYGYEVFYTIYTLKDGTKHSEEYVNPAMRKCR